MKVLVAMSGGVDSSVSAYLLKEAGYEVDGVTLKLWGGESDSGCCSVSDVNDAKRVAFKLGIEHRVLSLADDFEEKVINPYVKAYSVGYTPNPCIECNRFIKFDALLKKALRLGYDAIATGHYARVIKSDGKLRLARAVDFEKDQSYVLSMLSEANLKNILFPIGELYKKEVRDIAAVIGLSTAFKPDSQDVCFIAESQGGRKSFLAKKLNLKTAEIVEVKAGSKIGQVEDMQLFTVGQRKKIPVSPTGERRYVVDIDVAGGIIEVGTYDYLLTSELKITNISWVSNAPDEGSQVLVQPSAHGRTFEARWYRPDTLKLKTPQKRVARGQTVALYDTNENRFVLGSGIIC
jgi:tRNA-specific 2-thiouridylase